MAELPHGTATTDPVTGGLAPHTAVPQRQRRRRASVFGGARFFQPLPLWIWAASALVALLAATSLNGWVALLAIILLPLLGSLLWLRGEPPVLLFACGMQWLQASIGVLYTAMGDTPLEQPYGSELFRQATVLSLLGVLVVALGMRMALIRRKSPDVEGIKKESLRLKPGILFVVYLLVFVFSTLVSQVAWRVTSIMQPLLAITTLHWVTVFLLGLAVLSQRRGHGYLLLMVGLELGTGVLGYFSGFKNVFLVLFVVLLNPWQTLSARKVGMLTGMVVMLLLMGAAWTVVKEEYRDFLNQGTGMQAVLMPVPERFRKLSELVGGLGLKSMESGMDKMMLRVSYVNLFGLCLENVPAGVPHTNGELWSGAVKHIFMPRFLFPNKPVINDSDRTRLYAGINVAGGEEGTSIGIGYMAESYVDFGKAGMFVAIFILGMFYGLIYRYFSQYPVRILGLAAATAILVFGASAIETSNIKLFGGNFLAFLVLALFLKFAGPWFWRQISSPATSLRELQKAGTAPSRSHRHRHSRASRPQP